MSTFKSVVTTLGQSRIAAAIAAGTDINITQLAVGDGNGKATTPVATQTKLVKEVYRTPLNSLKRDPTHGNWVIAEAVLSASVGGFWMREMGLFSSDGALIAVCNMADTYKPTLAEGSGRTQTLRMVIAVSNTEVISLLIDDSVIMATEQYVNDLLSGFKSVIDAQPWIISKVTHSLGSSGFVTTLNLEVLLSDVSYEAIGDDRL